MEQKSYISQLVDMVKAKMPDWIKASAPSLAMKVFGKAKTPYVWTMSWAMKLVYKFLGPKVEAYLYELDKKKLDKNNIKEYEQAKKEGLSAEELRKKRLDMLNGKSN